MKMTRTFGILENSKNCVHDICKFFSWTNSEVYIGALRVL